MIGNRVQYTLTERNKYGLGGALYLGNDSYTLQDLTFSDNSAFLGGGLFASTNFAAGGQLQRLIYNQNNALLGENAKDLQSFIGGSPSCLCLSFITSTAKGQKLFGRECQASLC